MDLGIAGKRALVMGASGGLGRAIAMALAAEGVEVVLTARSADKLERTVADIAAAGGTASYLAADLSDPGAVDLLGDAAGQIDILVNNTGGPPPGTVTTADLSGLTSQFDTMVARIVHLTERLLPGMRDRGFGRVLTVASSGVIQPIPHLAVSNILRASLVGWSKSLATDVAGDGVTVNLLIPGRIHTDRVDSIDAGAAERSGQDIEAVRAASRATIPAGRYGDPAEFGAVAAFLASVPAAYVTGSQIRIDGGMIKSV
jgi:3-oxoacyl-[acyl-carrier protein] reductase